jgi:hypothetical protein
MSTPLSSIPKRARCVRYAHATNGERSATFAIYDDRASFGYQTDYTPVEVRWYAVDAPGIVRRAWRYTGSRYVRAEQDYRTALAEVLAEPGWSVTGDIPTLDGWEWCA